MEFDPFNRAIPGESLTKPMQDDPIFEEPKVDNLNEAYHQTIFTLMNNEGLYSDLMDMIEAGVDLESIANVITFGSFSKGQYSPDVAMQLTPLLALWMFLEADRNGIKGSDIKIMNFPKDKAMGNLSSDDMFALMKRRNPQKYEENVKNASTEKLETFFSELEGTYSEEELREPEEQQMGFMDMEEEPYMDMEEEPYMDMEEEPYMPEEMENV